MLRREPLAVSLLMGSRLPPRYGDTPQLLLFTTTQLLLRGKVLTVSVYSGYNDAADAAWLRPHTRRLAVILHRMWADGTDFQAQPA